MRFRSDRYNTKNSKHRCLKRIVLVFFIASIIGITVSQASNRSSITKLIFDNKLCLIPPKNDPFYLNAAVADTTNSHKRGLKYRTNLSHRNAMLFLYSSNQPETNAFWMQDTYIPLTVAFFNERGVINSIRTMRPCDAPFLGQCRHYKAGVIHHGALEVNQGLLRQLDVTIGARIRQATGPKHAPCSVTEPIAFPDNH